MTADITFSNLYWNDGLRGFLFRSQSEDTFNEVMGDTVDSPDTEQMMADFIESMFDDVDDMEEYFYNELPEDIVNEYREYHGIEVEDDED